MSLPHAPEDPEKPSPPRKAAPKTPIRPKKPSQDRPRSPKKPAPDLPFPDLSSIPAPRTPRESTTETTSYDPTAPHQSQQSHRAQDPRTAREAAALQALVDDTEALQSFLDTVLLRPPGDQQPSPTQRTPKLPHPHPPRESHADPHTHRPPPRHEARGGPRPDRRSGRVHVTARRSGVDVTALGRLALHLPHLLVSLAAVAVVSRVIDSVGGPPWWLPLGGWILGGAFVRHRSAERALARRLFGLRHPTPDEARSIRSAWREVAARAGVNPHAYQLWVEESDEINATAAVGHIVAVTSRSLGELPSDRLAGVLAHELGHHIRGHTWATLLVGWYALPARVIWRQLRLNDRLRGLTWGARFVVTALLAVALIVLATATYGLALLPFATPYLAAAISRRAELRADEHAASLGFAEQLSAVLHEETHREKPEPSVALGTEGPFWKRAVIARLLTPHPDVHTRLHHLHRHLDGPRADGG
ncbi:M48 family metalloprotease [Streptomyces boluensis]|uniref:M48 family metalloprotease n=1 Tax=Streptomyces boluensis TaxID=1775135 RepID=A0A964UJ35_9ACTN|nr:M48 family metalloprotease [Streptomyces boluensis]NBE50088.1 M48 family metalloprotease [Streptomyces boluensis]